MAYKIIKYGGKTKIKDTKTGKSVEIDIEKYMKGGSHTPKYGDGVDFDCPEGDLDCQKRKEEANKMGFQPYSTQDGKTYSTPQDYTSTPMTSPTVPNNGWTMGDRVGTEGYMSEDELLDKESLAVEADTKFLTDYQNNLASKDSNSLQSIMEGEATKREQKFNSDIDNTTLDLANEGAVDINENYNIANPYGGVDIPSSANYLGQSIKNKDTLGIISSGAKLMTGLARNVTSGLGAANRENQVMEDYYNKQKNNKNQIQYLAYGGKKDEELATGEFMHGVSNEEMEQFNAEIEKGEYFQTGEGDIAEVIGNKHANKGEKVQMEKDDRVLSDKLKLGAKAAKELADKYGLKLKAKNTYSDVLDKFKRSSKLSKLVEEEAEILKKVGEQKEVKDSVTRNFNLSVLSKKRDEITEEKHPIEEMRKEMFSELFDIQEASKPKEVKGNMLENGGNLEALSTEYNIPLDRAKELVAEFSKGGKMVPKYRYGIKIGETDPKTGKKVTKEEAAKRVASGEWEDLGEGRYVDKGAEGSEKISENSFNSYRKTWDENKFPKFEDYVTAAEDWKKENPNWNSTTTEKIPGTPDEFFYTDKDGVFMPDIKGHAIPTEKQPMGELMGNYKPGPKGEEDTEEIISKERGQSLAGAYLFPPDQPLPPSALQGSIKPEARFDRVSPNKIEVEPYLQDIRDREGSQVRSLEGLSPNARAAVLANVRANSQGQEADIRNKLDTQNLQSRDKAEYTNAQIQRREQILNNNYRQGYEQRVYRAQALTDNDQASYYDQLQDINKQRFQDIHNLNLINATNEDVAFVPGRGYVRKNTDQDIIRKIKV